MTKSFAILGCVLALWVAPVHPAATASHAVYDSDWILDKLRRHEEALVADVALTETPAQLAARFHELAGLAYHLGRSCRGQWGTADPAQVRPLIKSLEVAAREATRLAEQGEEPIGPLLDDPRVRADGRRATTRLWSHTLRALTEDMTRQLGRLISRMAPLGHDDGVWWSADPDRPAPVSQ